MKSFAFLIAAVGVAGLVAAASGLDSGASFGRPDIDITAGPFEPDPQSPPRVSATLFPGCSGLPAPAELPLFVVGHYEGGTLSTAWLGDEEEEAHVIDVDVAGGAPIHLIVTSYGPTIYRFSGATDRISHLTLMNRTGAGAIGIPTSRITFASACLPHNAFYRSEESNGADADALVRSHYRRSAALSGGNYDILRFRVGDRIAVTEPPNVSASGADPETQELHRFSPGGISHVDAAAVVSAVPVAPYRVLPQEAGVRQLVRSGALVRTSASYGNYRVVRPITMPAGLCGAHSIQLTAPGPSYISGDPCHTRIRFDDGTGLGLH